jgi:hypothetical protein
MQNPATIVAIAWPDTKVVKEGKWYDLPMQWLGVIKNGYYTAGHAALMLVDHITGEVHYFDFGRYHTPHQYGRVRDKFTDPDVAVNLNAIIENGEIKNLEELLLERYSNKACHGDGKLTAALVNHIDFNKAYQKAKALQNREAIPYGPFTIKGSTCSRLVVQVVYEATNNLFTKLLIKLPYTVSATPRSNKKVLNDLPYYYEVENNQVFKYKNTWHPFKRLFSPTEITYRKNQIPRTA